MRNAVIVMGVVVIAAACSSDAGGQAGTMTLPAIKTQASPQAVVDEHLDAINKCDWSRLMAQYPENVEFFLPKGEVVRSIQEDPKSADVLYLGTETGLWVSWNRGGQWTRLKANLPTMPIYEIKVHPRDNDLILASHARGIWILDDLAPIQQWAKAVSAAWAAMSSRSGSSRPKRSRTSTWRPTASCTTGSSPPAPPSKRSAPRRRRPS